MSTNPSQQISRLFSEVAQREGYHDVATTATIVRLENPYTKKYLITVDGRKRVAFAIADQVYEPNDSVRVLVPTSEADQDYVILNKVQETDVQSAISNNDRFTEIYQFISQTNPSAKFNIADIANSLTLESSTEYIDAINTTEHFGIRVTFDLDAYVNKGSTYEYLNYATKYGFIIKIHYGDTVKDLIFNQDMVPGHPFYTVTEEGETSRKIDYVFENIPDKEKITSITIATTESIISINEGIVQISNFAGYIVEGKVIEDKNTYVVVAPQGKTLQSDKNIYLQGTMRDMGVPVNSGVTYYWFRKNPMVVKGSTGYREEAGEGWELMYPTTNPDAAESLNLEQKEE